MGMHFEKLFETKIFDIFPLKKMANLVQLIGGDYNLVNLQILFAPSNMIDLKGYK